MSKEGSLFCREKMLRMNAVMEELEVTERDWIKTNFLALAKKHKESCQGCEIHLLTLKIALDKLGIPLTIEESQEFSGRN